MSAGILNTGPQVDGILDRVRRQILWHTIVRGFATVMAISLATVLLATTCDYVLGLPSIVRAVSLLAAVAIVAATTWKHLIKPLREAIPRTQLAAAVDLSCPGLDESLATLLSLQQPDVTASEAGSEIMRRRLQQQVAERVSTLRSDSVVDSRETQRRSGYAGLLIIVALVPLLFWPSGSKLLLQRMVAPYGNLATATNLYFEIETPNRTVAKGSTVQFVATARWRTKAHAARPEVVSVNLLAIDGRRESLPMTFDELSGNYITELARIEDSIQYQVTGGGAETELFSVLVVDAPEICSAILNASPPAYTGQAVRQFDGVIGHMEVFERSDMEIQLTFNKPVESASLLWIRRDPEPLSEVAEFNLTFDHLTGEEVVEDVSTDWDPSRNDIEKRQQPDAEDMDPDAPLFPEKAPLANKLAGTLSGDRLSAVFYLQADVGGDFVFEIVDEHQLLNGNEPDRSLQVIYDLPPELTVRSVRNGDQFRPDDILPIDVLAVDDIGLGALELHYRIDNQVTRIVPATDFEKGVREVDYGFRLELQNLNVASGATVSFRVRAADERPQPGRQQTWSQEFTVQINQDAQAAGAKAMAEESKAIVDALKRLETEITADQKTAEALEQKAPQDWNEQSRSEAGRLSEKEQQQGRLLEKIAERVATHPLMQGAANELTDVAEQLKDDIPAALDEASTTDRNEAREQMQSATVQLEQARQQLQKQISDIETIAELEQDLAELNRLALDAEQLAANADQLEQDRSEPENRPLELTEQQWEQAIEDRRQQLMSEQQELTDDLQRLLEEERQLLDAAQRSQRDQLAEIAEAAQQLAEQQRDVAEGVQQEATEAGQRARDIANQLEQLGQDASNLNEQVAKDASDVNRPDPAALQQAAEDLRQGDLATPQATVRGSAQQMQTLTEQLQQPAAEADAASNERRQQNAQQARQMADQLQALEEQIQRLRQERNATGADDEQAPGTAEQQAAVENIMERMQELTDAANQLAQQTSADPGASPSAQQQAQEAADRSKAATAEAQAGDFAQSAQQMRKAGDAAQQSSQQLDTPEQQDQQQQLAGLSEEFDRTAQALDNMRLDDGAQATVQQNTQEQIAEQAAELPQQLSDLAERLNMEALQMADEAQQAGHAQQAARQAQQSSQQASSGLQNGQLQQASQSGQQAAEQLSQVAQAASQNNQTPSSESQLVPSEVGESVAEALQNLAQAAQAMQQSSQNGKGQPGQSDDAAEQASNGQPGQQPGGDQAAAGEGQQPGQDDSSQSGQGGQPGQPGQGQSSGSQQLSSAARSLAQAAQQALPNQFTPGQPGSESNGSSTGSDANGNTATWDGLLPGKSSGPAGTRDWGQLNQELETETSGDVRVSRDSEYQSLIRMYFREVARQSGERKK